VVAGAVVAGAGRLARLAAQPPGGPAATPVPAAYPR